MLVLFVVVIWIANSMNNAMRPQGTSSCEIGPGRFRHSWSFKQQPGDDTWYMTCDRCGKQPGVEDNNA